MWKYISWTLAVLLVVIGASLMILSGLSLERHRFEKNNISLNLKVTNFEKELIGKSVNLKNAKWHFNENDSMKIVEFIQIKPLEEVDGFEGTLIVATIECQKPENVVLYGTLVFIFKGKEIENSSLYQINNVNAEILKEYK